MSETAPYEPGQIVTGSGPYIEVGGYLIEVTQTRVGIVIAVAIAVALFFAWVFQSHRR